MAIQEVGPQLSVIHSNLNENQKPELKKSNYGHSTSDSISSAADLDLYALDVKVAVKDAFNPKRQTEPQTSTCNSTCQGCRQTDSGCYGTQQTCTNNC